MIRLTHPLHGTKHAQLESEAQSDEANGWTRAPESVAPVETQDVELTMPARSDNSILSDDPVTQYVAKFGAPPHHRMKMETILARLKE